MPGVQRVGDKNSGGGLIITGDTSVMVNNRPVATRGRPVSPHLPCGVPGGAPHCSATTTNTNFSVLVNGIPIVLTGDTDTCGHTRSIGSTDVIVG